MTAQRDLIVIGTGTAGTTAAERCHAAGWNVAIVDSRPYGGTCALRGCVPKKILADAAGLVDASRRMADRGVGGARGTGDAEAVLDWPALSRFLRTFTDPFPEKREREFAAQGIATLHGAARFTGPTQLEVGGDTHDARHLIIATGAIPMPLEFAGAELLTTSDAFLALEYLPEAIVFVGGGFISFEFAHVVARAGVHATILHAEEQPLAGFDADLVARLVARTTALGIELRLKTTVTGIRRDGDALVLTTRGPGGEAELRTPLAVHGAGRVPDLAGLDLEAGGITYDDKGVTVNTYLQSVSNAAVYAAGDAAATSGAALTPVASYEGRVAAINLTEGDHCKTDYTIVPSVVFTTPPLAAVGLTEQAAREQHVTVDLHQGDMADWFTARHVGETHAAYKILLDPATGKILGAHVLGPDAGEVINVFALAMRAGLTADDLRTMRLAYPTAGADILSMLE